ncbi:MAG: hypothetical protein HY770_03995 [Chitinivibrionia bacterium]|nr:hypothetical protein [Chitinivibrionia bacterium]
MAIGFALTLVPVLAFAGRTVKCTSQDESLKEKAVKKVCVVSKDGCMTTAHLDTDMMLPPEAAGSSCCGHCMQTGRHICVNAAPMKRMMFIGDHGCAADMCGGPHGGGSCIEGILAMEDELTLSDEQKHQLREIKHGVALAMLDLEAALAKERLTLEKLLGDEAAIEEIARQLESVSGAECKLKLKKISSEREAMSVLSKDQQAAIKAHKPPQNFKWTSADDPSCLKEIEVNVEEGDRPGERKVIIIKNPDTENRE